MQINVSFQEISKTEPSTKEYIHIFSLFPGCAVSEIMFVEKVSLIQKKRKKKSRQKVQTLPKCCRGLLSCFLKIHGIICWHFVLAVVVGNQHFTFSADHTRPELWAALFTGEPYRKWKELGPTVLSPGLATRSAQ